MDSSSQLANTSRAPPPPAAKKTPQTQKNGSSNFLGAEVRRLGSDRDLLDFMTSVQGCLSLFDNRKNGALWIVSPQCVF